MSRREGVVLAALHKCPESEMLQELPTRFVGRSFSSDMEGQRRSGLQPLKLQGLKALHPVHRYCQTFRSDPQSLSRVADFASALPTQCSSRGRNRAAASRWA